MCASALQLCDGVRVRVRVGVRACFCFLQQRFYNQQTALGWLLVKAIVFFLLLMGCFNVATLRVVHTKRMPALVNIHMYVYVLMAVCVRMANAVTKTMHK